MIQILRIAFIFSFVFSTQLLFAQSKKVDLNLATIEKNEWKKELSNYVSHLDFFKKEKDNLGLAQAEDLQMKQVVETKGNWKHTKYQQFYEGIPVLNGIYILHEKAGDLRKANGNLLPNIQVKTTPNYSAEKAIEIAKSEALDAAKKEYGGKLPKGLNFNTIENSPVELYVADKRYPRNTGDYTLAYVFELEFNSYPPRHDQYIFDALSGNVIDVIPQVCHLHVPGTIKTTYYGEKNVVVDSISENEYRLQDFTRGNGIVTENDYTGEAFVSESRNFDLENDFQDEAAGAAHWAASRYYDWLLDSFNFNSIDNQGHELRSIIHLNEGESVVNAFWNGRFASFGDGNCGEVDPLTSIDVVSHEFTHGLTRFNSNLVYRYESGGLNESMSDMFGKGLEWYLNPDGFTWEVGRDFQKDSLADPFRDMSDPNTQRHPKYYKGNFWSFSGEAVHTNSNVMNHWFYLLVEGGSGRTERDEDFDVEKLGMENTMQIVFTINTAYLVPNSDYQHAYESTIEVATDLWGVGSSELASVREAWRAVGISVADDFTVDRDLAIHLLNKDTMVCGNDATREIMVEIENLSNVDLAAGMEIELGFRLNSGAGADFSGRKTEIFTLAADLPQGEKLQLTFDETLSFANSTGTRERIEVFVAPSFNDENPINNIDFREVFVTEIAGTDVSFDIQNLGNTLCQPDEIQFQLRVRNEGCTPIPAGTEMSVDFIFMSETETYTLTLQNDLMQNNRHNETITIAIDSIPGGEIQYSGLLTYADDERAGNNDNNGTVQLFKQTGSDYFESFDDFNPTNDPNLFINTGGKNLVRTIEYSGETMLGFTGTGGGSSNTILRGCDLLNRILKGHDGFNSTAEFCVDMTGFDTPNLSFDLVQFSGANGFEIPENYSSVFFVRTSDPDFEEVVIVDQAEGDIVSHNIPLPADFSGQIFLESFTLFGNIVAFAQRNFDIGSVHLLDNVRVSNGPVSTSQIADNQHVSVFPNPATNVVWFENHTNEFSNFDIEIFNSLGAKIQVITNVSGKAEWNTDNRQAGVYFYKITSDGAQIGAGKLILEK